MFKLAFFTYTATCKMYMHVVTETLGLYTIQLYK